MILIVLSLFAAFGITVFFLLPSISEMFFDLNIPLPFITKIVISFADFITNFWYLIAFAAAAAILGLLYVKLYHPLKFAKWELNLPLYHGIKFNDLQFRFARLFSVCIAAGLNTRRALELTAGSVDNILVSETVKKTVDYMSHSGMSITAALEKANIYNVIDVSFYRVIEAGTKGNMADIMEKRANFFSQRITCKFQNFRNKSE